ncbi:MAG: AraC family transcriptional regulator [Oscillospiraceae bacterium]|nr:AraC family transcriptional regulator [Oscillospiraceae bacterium]
MNPILLEHIGNIVDYIEEHIKESLSLEGLSESLFISPFYLNRIFSAITGQPLMRYVSGRKLMCSLEELLNTDMRIIDIANEYGYSFENSYIRAFKREFGLAPNEYRKSRCELSLTAAINLNQLAAINEQSILIKPKMVVKPEFSLAGLQTRMSVTDNLENAGITDFANEFIANHMQCIPDIVDKNSYYGYVESLAEHTAFSYTAAFEISSSAIVPTGYVKHTLPSSKYWVFRFVALHSPACITQKEYHHMFYLIRDWFKLGGLDLSFPMHFERIDGTICTNNYCEIDLYYPVNNC